MTMTKPSTANAPVVRTYLYPNAKYWKGVSMAANRMAVSEQKYGSIEDNYPNKGQDAVATLRDRLALYEETGNTEWLLDVANMALIEHALPSHPDAHFRATDSDESPGIVGR